MAIGISGVLFVLVLVLVEYVPRDPASNRVLELERVIQDMEWAGIWGTCPYCTATPYVHKEDCILGAALRSSPKR